MLPRGSVHAALVAGRRGPTTIPERPGEDLSMIDATRLSPAEQKAFYDEQGYIVHPELLSQDEVAVLRAALAETLQEAEGLTESNENFSVPPGAAENHTDP